MIEDIGDFFDDDDALDAVRSRPLEAPVPFRAIPGEEDGEALDAHVIATHRRIAFATGPDVVEGDTITLTGLGALAAYNGDYLVRRVERVNDGLESRAVLKKVLP